MSEVLWAIVQWVGIGFWVVIWRLEVSEKREAQQLRDAAQMHLDRSREIEQRIVRQVAMAQQSRRHRES